MLIYKCFFPYLFIFYGRGLKGRAGRRQTEVQTDRRFLSPTPRIGEQTDGFAIARTNIALLGNVRQNRMSIKSVSTGDKTIGQSS